MIALDLPKAWVYGQPKPGTATPGGPRPVYDIHRADMLTTVLADGTAELQDFVSYTKRSPEHRARIRAAHVKAGMTRYCENTIVDGLDWFGDPHTFVGYLQELKADGLGPILFVGLEDSPKMQAKYKDISVLTAAISKAFPLWAPHTTEVWLGVEVNEYWTDSEVRTVAKAVRSAFNGPIAVHYGQGRMGGDWAAMKAAGVTHFAFQSTHPAVEDAGQGFLADPNKIKDELKSAVAAVKGHVKVLASEYAFFGRNPSKSVVKTISERGYALGEKALEVSGIAGISNGGPGYWPEEVFVPPPPGAAVDEVDLSTVRFYTRTNSDQTKEIARWPIESILKGKIVGNDIFFDHAAKLSWPNENGVNANCWVGFWRDGLWHCYTLDFMRPGQVEKEWAGTGFENEPNVGWKPRKGEEVLMMVSRIARSGNYPNGKGRTQLIKAVIT